MADLFAKIGANTTDFDAKMKGVTARMKKVGDQMQSVGKTLSLSLTAPLLALGAVALKAFDTQIKAEKKLKAALLATGQEVDNNFKDFKKFASELQNVSLIGDEATLQMLQLATSMGLNAESAKRASKNAIAMASALGISEQSAIKMTAALEQGDATMLTRYLPSLRSIEDQSERAAEAQRLLAQMFGTVTAEAEDGLGPMIQMTNTIGDLMEQFGAIIADGLKPLFKWIKKVAEGFQAMSPDTKALIVKIAALVAGVGPLLVALGFLASTVLPAVGSALLVLTGPVGLVVAAIGIAVFEIQRNWDEIVKYFTSGPAAAAWNEFKELIDKIFGLIPDSIGSGADLIIKIWDQFIVNFITPIRAAFDEVFLIIKLGMGILGDLIDAGTAAMAGDWAGFWNEMKSIVIRIFSFMVKSVAIGVNSMLKVMGSLAGFFDDEWAASLKNAQDKVNSFSDSLIERASEFIGFKQQARLATAAVKGFGKAVEELAAKKPAESLIITPEGGGGGGAISDPFAGLGSNISSAADELAFFNELEALAEAKLQALKDKADSVGAAVGSAFQAMGSKIVASFGEAETGLGRFAQAMGNTVIQLLAQALAAAVASAIQGATISAAFTGPGAVFAQPAFIATAVGGVLAAFAAIPKFAEGTMNAPGGFAMVGELGPELVNLPRGSQVIPNNMLGGGQGGSIVTFRIRGNDLVAVHRNQGIRNNQIFPGSNLTT